MFEDSVIQTRTNLAVTESGASFRVTVPPLPSFTVPPGNVFHCPSGARPSGLRPTQ